VACCKASGGLLEIDDGRCSTAIWSNTLGSSQTFYNINFGLFIRLEDNICCFFVKLSRHVKNIIMCNIKKGRLFFRIKGLHPGFIKETTRDPVTHKSPAKTAGDFFEF
jgi:hypothetical protein